MVILEVSLYGYSKEIKRNQSQNGAGRDVDQVMLFGEDTTESDEQRKGKRAHAKARI